MTVRRTLQLAVGIMTLSFVLLLGSVVSAQDKTKPAETVETSAPAKAESKPLPAKVATVNGVTISGNDLTREYAIYLQRTGQKEGAVPVGQRDKITSDILDGLIDQELLFQESRKLGIQVENAVVDEQIAAIKKRYQTEAEFKADLESMQMSEVQVKSQIERGLAIREVINQKVANAIVIDEAESKTFYEANPQYFSKPERVKASHILIMVPKTASAEEKAAARKKIEDVRKQAQSGTPFADLAKTYSDDGSKQKGGDLGYFRRGMMVPPFEKAAFELEKDQISGVVETQYGYHLIKVTDKAPAETVGFAEAKERISAHLKQEKVEKEARTYIDSLKKSAKVDKFI